MTIKLGAKKDGTLRGINLMGIRYRHEYCDHWLRHATPLRDVMQNLRFANFDPEFFKQYEQTLLGLYNRRFPDHPIATTGRRGLFKRFLTKHTEA